MVDAGEKGEGPDKTGTDDGTTGDGDSDPPATTGDGTDGTDGTPSDGTDGTPADGTDGTPADDSSGDAPADDTSGDDTSADPDAGSGTGDVACLGTPGPQPDSSGIDCGSTDTVTVTGHVFDVMSQGSPVSGVTVTASPCDASTTTDDNGEFSLDVPASAIVYYHLDGSGAGYENGLSPYFSTDASLDQTMWMLQTGYVSTYTAACTEMDPALIVIRAFDNSTQSFPGNVQVSSSGGVAIGTTTYMDSFFQPLDASTDSTQPDGSVLITDLAAAPASDTFSISSSASDCSQDDASIMYPFERGYVTAVQISMTCN